MEQCSHTHPVFGWATETNLHEILCQSIPKQRFSILGISRPQSKSQAESRGRMCRLLSKSHFEVLHSLFFFSKQETETTKMKAGNCI